jgi:hypothetical protein
MNSMNTSEKHWSSKCIFILRLYQFILFVSTKLFNLDRFKLVYLRDYSVVFFILFYFH